ncbi:hypothetical protein [Rhodococcoides kyotonense]|uniref:Ig-like domain-containing protein n=1 Tax=Rhodococcoides kyotonense TaxID=398843 RepID=A0A239MEY8_9NOCA|nr:hypothetical protein [Rhodococcus kyotonensis]SNT40359.1 hypothetical protein SAMN05421642_11761 [Rhodococcus kyotonensis]
MRKTATALLAATAAVPLSLAFATPAQAAPGDVTAVFSSAVTSTGVNTVTGTFTFAGGAAPTYCGFGDVDDFVETGFEDPGLYVANNAVPTGASLVLTDPVVADGTYTIEWACRQYAAGGGEQTEAWGTPAAQIPGGATAHAVVITVPEFVEPEPEPVCTGSACLPTGSFGF